jgi:hypothetical protein
MSLMLRLLSAPAIAFTPESRIVISGHFVHKTFALPARLSMASADVGSVPHASGELAKMMTGAEMIHVPTQRSVGPSDEAQIAAISR